jgi:hypothetical protein
VDKRTLKYDKCKTIGAPPLIMEPISFRCDGTPDFSKLGKVYEEPKVSLEEWIEKCGLKNAIKQ